MPPDHCWFLCNSIITVRTAELSVLKSLKFVIYCGLYKPDEKFNKKSHSDFFHYVVLYDYAFIITKIGFIVKTSTFNGILK